MIVIGIVIALVVLVLLSHSFFRDNPSPPPTTPDDSRDDTTVDEIPLRSGDLISLKNNEHTMGVCGSSEGAKGGCINTTGEDFNVTSMVDPPVDQSTWAIHKISQSGIKEPNGTSINTGDDVVLTISYKNSIGVLQVCGMNVLRTTVSDLPIGSDPTTIIRIEQQGNDGRRGLNHGDVVLLEYSLKKISIGEDIDGLCEGWKQVVVDNKPTHWEII